MINLSFSLLIKRWVNKIILIFRFIIQKFFYLVLGYPESEIIVLNVICYSGSEIIFIECDSLFWVRASFIFTDFVLVGCSANGHFIIALRTWKK